MTNSRSDALVFFGATGDLAYKQIFPALHSMVGRGTLSMPVIGVAKSGWNRDQLIGRAKESIQKSGRFDPGVFEKLTAMLQYIDGDYASPGTFTQLRKALGEAKSPLHYLAIPPGMFETVAERLAESGCANQARVVVEKPFGRDFASAQKLNGVLRRFFPESSIFRIDHYLGKEPVENIIYFRFANPLVNSGWNNSEIDQVQITMAENFGVAGRGKFYEEAGAVRDVVQNHMLQVIASLAMELPEGGDSEALRDSRAALIKSMRPLTAADILKGQFRGYRQEPGVAPDSKVETFASMRFQIENDRWRGVPFWVRVGKSLPVTVNEIFVKLKSPGHPVLDEHSRPPANYYRLRLTPDTVIAVGANVKKAGAKFVGEQVELVAHHRAPDEMQPYERLLGDALNGEISLFAREDFVEEAWRVVDPILQTTDAVFEYDQNSWGPPQAETTLVPDGGWINPVAEEK